MVSTLHIKYGKGTIGIVIKKYLWKGIRFLHAAKLRFDGEGITMASCASVRETGVEDDGIIVQHHARSKKITLLPTEQQRFLKRGHNMRPPSFGAASSGLDLAVLEEVCRPSSTVEIGQVVFIHPWLAMNAHAQSCSGRPNVLTEALARHVR